MKQTVYIFFLLAASAAGALLRAVSLLRGYEPESGLPVAGYPPSVAVIVLTAAVIVLAVLLSRQWYPAAGQRSFEQVFGGLSGIGGVAGMLCGVLCALAGGAGLLLLPRQIMEQTNEYVSVSGPMIGIMALMWALCLVSGAVILALSLWQAKEKKATRRVGLFATVPMFWCGLDLILTYHENSGNPVTSDYSYALLLIIALMAAFYSMAGFLFSANRGNSAQFAAAAGIAVYLTAVHVLGTLASMILGGTELLTVGNTIRLWAYFAAGVFLLVQLLHMKKSA